MSIQLKTLGQFSVFRDGKEETAILSWRRRLALLTYLGVEGEATRDQLTTLFWPEKRTEKARHSLNQALYEIRRACGSDCLVSQGGRVRSSDILKVDAAQFQRLAGEDRHAEALEYYGGEFLPGVHLVATPEFEAWVERTRARLRRVHRRSRDSIIQVHFDDGQIELALPVARRWAELEPLEDEAQFWFIRLLLLSGRRSEALLQYESFERALAKDDLHPLDDTRTLVEQIRRGEDDGSPVHRKKRIGGDQQQVPGPVPPPEKNEGVDSRWLPFHDLIQSLKDRWVFRVTLTYVAALFVWIQVADALIGIDLITPLGGLRVTTLGLAAMPGVLGLVWAGEPRMRNRGQKKGTSGDHSSGLGSHLKGVWRGTGAALMVAASAVLGVFTWPGGANLPPFSTTTEGPVALRHGFAILPIQPEDTTDAFMTGVSAHLTRSLITHFRDFDVLNVPSESRVARYANAPPPPDTILNQLGVEVLLNGLLGQRGDSLFVSLDLESKGLSGEHLMTWVPVLGGVNEIELVELVSTQVSDQLRRKLRVEFRSRDLRLGTSSPRAWQLAHQGEDERLRAVRLMNRRNFQGAERALEVADTLFSAAIAEDPGWPDPHFFRGFMATTWVSLAQTSRNIDPESPQAVPLEGLSGILREGLDLIRPGLLINPTHKDGLYKKAEVLRFLSYYPEHPDSVTSIRRDIEEALEGAIRGDPPRPDAMLRLAQLRYGQGDFERALELYEDAYERDVFQQRLATDLLYLGRLRLEFGRDLMGFNECSEADVNASGWDEFMLHECQLLLMGFGDQVEPNVSLAKDLVEAAVIQGPDMGGTGPTQGLLTLYAAVLARAGLADSARAVYRQLPRRGPESPPSEYEVAFLAHLGESAQALEGLRRGPDLPLHSKLFAPLRGFPLFDSLQAAREKTQDPAG